MKVQNENKVPKNQWKKWSPQAQRVFNHLYAFMRANQILFIHPKVGLVSDCAWKTTSWNSAWEAAYAVDNV